MNEVKANTIYTAIITHSNPVMNCTVSFFIVARMLSIHFISFFTFCVFSFLEFFCVAILFVWFSKKPQSYGLVIFRIATTCVSAAV